jgi:hypothetical protein
VKRRTIKACISIILLAALVSCGGGAGSGSDSGFVADITAAEIDSIAKAITSAAQAVESVVAAQSQAAADTGNSGTFMASTQSTCPGGGFITSEGEIALAYDPAEATVTSSGDITLQLSAHASVSDDCKCLDLYLDGFLTLTVAGIDPDYAFPVFGSIGLDRIDAEGELVHLADSCAIELTFQNGAVTGTVCGNPI